MCYSVHALQHLTMEDNWLCKRKLLDALIMVKYNHIREGNQVECGVEGGNLKTKTSCKELQ